MTPRTPGAVGPTRGRTALGGRDPYGGGVRRTSRSWLWGLLAALLFGLVLMHHTPSHGGHDPEFVSAAAAGSAPALIKADCPCLGPDHGAAMPGGGGESGNVLLHLCLAVLAALVGQLVAGLVRRWTVSTAGASNGSGGRRAGLEYLRPLLPVPRRLAALCVLRL